MDRLNNSELRIIPHYDHRYPTVGDYYDEGLYTRFEVSAMGDARMEFLVYIHERIEEFLTRMRGISEADIKAFDEAYEAARPEGDVSEPGDHPNAPYRAEHQFATKIERQIADEIGVDWDEYSRVVESL
jgi:hypothetical protein